ncbi:carbonic anhydrase [Setomelanomma holmii]|uniref:Carbonic anhydrase n=1 Tax=Setomelanomma holmii TaxID=210430 RepID=A0A9P4HBT1_9PLEO|nr:carbonic anhydrase [Setomelanomma holmii]
MTANQVEQRSLTKMAESTATERILAGNAKWHPTYKTPATMEQMRLFGSSGDKPMMVVTCMDPRCDPSQFTGGDEIFATIKNAGGRATPDAIRSILTLRALNTVSDKGTVAVIHHTDCGMTHVTEDEIKGSVKKRTPTEAARAEGIDYGTFGKDEFEEIIRKDVQTFKDEKLLGGMDVLGFAFITETGELKPVC